MTKEAEMFHSVWQVSGDFCPSWEAVAARHRELVAEAVRGERQRCAEVAGHWVDTTLKGDATKWVSLKNAILADPTPPKVVSPFGCTECGWTFENDKWRRGSMNAMYLRDDAKCCDQCGKPRISK